MKLIPNPQTPADHLVNAVADVLHEAGEMLIRDRPERERKALADEATAAVMATMKEQGLGRVSRI